MRWILIISLLIFSMIEVYLLRAFTVRKEKLSFKSTATSFVVLWLAVIATYLFGLKIPDFAFIFVMVNLTVHSYFGYYLNRYNKSRRFDRIAHGLGSFSFAIFAYYFFANIFTYGGSRVFQAFYILLLGISIGAAYEIFEFIADLKLDEKLQRGLRDTNIDVVSDVIGSLAAAVFALIVLL